MVGMVHTTAITIVTTVARRVLRRWRTRPAMVVAGAGFGRDFFVAGAAGAAGLALVIEPPLAGAAAPESGRGRSATRTGTAPPPAPNRARVAGPNPAPACTSRWRSRWSR